MASTMIVQDATTDVSSSSAGSLEEGQLIAALRRGDEAAFVTLVERYHRPMLRLALRYVASEAVAEEVVQETWLGVLEGIGRFAGRSSLKTWLFHILTNIAKTRGQREHRSVPFSQLAVEADGTDAPVVDPERFGADGHWSLAPQSWEGLPEERFLAHETQAYVRSAIAALPARQRDVISLRDVEGWDADEVCDLLGLSAVHQRVLLHRARSSVRQALEAYIARDANAAADAAGYQATARAYMA
jgi:RNA polymerase sigma-70 factor (ECF subfamily)